MTLADDSIVVSIIEPLEAPGPAPTLAGGGRRESDCALGYWYERIFPSGANATVSALDAAEFDSSEWSHRFVMTIDQLLDGSALLFCGADAARQLDLPSGSKAREPILRRLPPRYFPIFRRGCEEVLRHNSPVRVEGEVERPDGRKELFRAIILPVGGGAGRSVQLAFGAFGCKLL